MPDIDLYEKTPQLYDELQNLRPDYQPSKQVFIDLSTHYLQDKKDLVVADFCCGTGKNTEILAEHLHVSKAVLVDINKNFLDAAKKTIKKIEIEAYQTDILKMNFIPAADVVISMFAYHHVSDGEKSLYIQKVSDVLKGGGLLILGEIYMPNRQVTIKYYDKLFESIPQNSKSIELKKFLDQTARSDDFEFKVARSFSHDQLNKAGFILIESKKIWPNDDELEKDVGTFVEVWKFTR